VHWFVFRCIDCLGDESAKSMCKLDGQGIEEPEFADVSWKPFAEVISTLPVIDRPHYLALQYWLEPQLQQYAAAVASVDRGGAWMRTARACAGVVALL